MICFLPDGKYITYTSVRALYRTAFPPSLIGRALADEFGLRFEKYENGVILLHSKSKKKGPEAVRLLASCTFDWKSRHAHYFPEGGRA